MRFETTKQGTDCCFFFKGWLSQCYNRTPFYYNGIKFQNCEQFMMAKKALLFKDLITYKKIMDSSTPYEQKQLGREVKNFVPEEWDKVKCSIVAYGNLLKFSQNQTLCSALLNSKCELFVEASPYDKIWGIGLSEMDDSILDEDKWNGDNLLGEAITSVRDVLRYNFQ